MAIKRYKPSADSTITNAYKSDLVTRATGSNMGAADILELFHIYGAATTSVAASASENSRIIMKFPISNVSTDRSSGTIPASGSVSFYLRLHNAEHGNTLPSDYKIVVHPMSGASASVWTEGDGVDMDTYLDAGYTNWTASYSSSADGINWWVNEGGDFYDGDGYT